jgi:hypothetical protein
MLKKYAPRFINGALSAILMGIGYHVFGMGFALSMLACSIGMIESRMNEIE